MQSSKPFAVPKMKLGIDAKSHLRFKPFLLIRGEVSACSFNPSGELVKVINIGIGGASKLTQGGIVHKVLATWWNERGFETRVVETAFRFDDLDDARRLLGFFFGDRGVAGAALEVPFRVGIFTRLSLGA